VRDGRARAAKEGEQELVVVRLDVVVLCLWTVDCGVSDEKEARDN